MLATLVAGANKHVWLLANFIGHRHTSTSQQQQICNRQASFLMNVAIKESEEEPKLQKPPWPKALREGYLKSTIRGSPHCEVSLPPAPVRRLLCPPHYVLAKCQTIPIVHPSCRLAEEISVSRHHVFFLSRRQTPRCSSFHFNPVPPGPTALVPLPLYAIYRTPWTRKTMVGWTVR